MQVHPGLELPALSGCAVRLYTDFVILIHSVLHCELYGCAVALLTHWVCRVSDFIFERLVYGYSTDTRGFTGYLPHTNQIIVAFEGTEDLVRLHVSHACVCVLMSRAFTGKL